MAASVCVCECTRVCVRIKTIDRIYSSQYTFILIRFSVMIVRHHIVVVVVVYFDAFLFCLFVLSLPNARRYKYIVILETEHLYICDYIYFSIFFSTGYLVAFVRLLCVFCCVCIQYYTVCNWCGFFLPLNKTRNFSVVFFVMTLPETCSGKSVDCSR